MEEVSWRQLRCWFAFLAVLLSAGIPSAVEAQQQAPPLSAQNLVELLGTGMPEARILQMVAEACVIRGADPTVQRQLEQAGASQALRRTAGAFACSEVGTVARVEITSIPGTLIEGQEHQLGVRVLGPSGEELQGRSLRWSVSDASVVSVTPRGTIRALGPGNSEIRAEVDAVIGVAQISVRTNEPRFTPFTSAPEVRNRQAVGQALEEEYPPLLRDAGVGGTVLMYFFIDDNGVVRDYRVHESSGHTALDLAAMRVATVFEFSAALLRGTRVPVWIQIPITFSTR